MRDTSVPRPDPSLPGRYQGKRLQGQERTKDVLKLNWEWYGAWIAIINGAMIAAGLYYFASGRPTGSSGMASGLPLRWPQPQ